MALPYSNATSGKNAIGEIEKIQTEDPDKTRPDSGENKDPPKRLMPF